MKTIFQKEWRENFKLAILAFVILGLALAQEYRTCITYFTELGLGGTSWQPENAQPLLASGVLFEVKMICGIFGAILGWLQIHNERHRDLRAFLIHRPISRTKIFFGKVLAGLCVYAAGAGLPLLGFIIMVRIPGHFPVPFVWTMALPIVALFLSGLVFYFAGLLTSIREARWYVSRGLGLGAGLLLWVIISRVPDFWRVLIYWVPAVVIVGIAAWGSFISNGYYEGQPKAGQRALTASLMLGCFLVMSFVTLLLLSMRSNEVGSWTNYQMGKNGTIYKLTRDTGKPVVISDLNGVTLIDKSTGRAMLQNDFYKLTASENRLQPDFETNIPTFYAYRGFAYSANYFCLWRQTQDTLWYWCPNGRLWAYDMASRRFIGSMGPSGFAQGLTTGPDHFTRLESQYGYGYYYQYYPARTLMTDTAVYQLDYNNRTSRPFFTTTNSERIGDALDISMDMGSWDYTLVVTRDFVYILKPDGQTLCQVPYEPKYPSYTEVQVNFLQPTNQFAFWFSPSYATNSLMHWKLPTHIVWAEGSSKITKSLDLPSDERTWKASWIERLPELVMPPVGLFITSFLYQGNVLWEWKYYFTHNLAYILMPFGGAIICVGVGWWLGRRYHFTGQSQLKWAVFHLCFNLPGLLAFLCVQEWPAREACPNCKKLRLVDRKKCEYCEAEFAPPAKNGTEIFEVAGK